MKFAGIIVASALALASCTHNAAAPGANGTAAGSASRSSSGGGGGDGTGSSGHRVQSLSLSGPFAGSMRVTDVRCSPKGITISGTLGSVHVSIGFAPSQKTVGATFLGSGRPRSFVGHNGATYSHSRVRLTVRLDGYSATGRATGETERARGSVACTS